MKDNSPDEFKWEKLFREEEKSVRDYLDLLPKYIYLPGEDMLMSGQKAETESFDSEDNDEEEDFELSWKKHKDSIIVEKLLKLSKSWLLIQNAVLSNKEKPIGLRISALLAMSTGRLLTVISSSNENPEFCVANYKRLRKEFCTCENNMRALIKLSPQISGLIEEKIHVVMELIAFASDKIFEFRKKIS
ncbi:MAG TPA: hypothetical protein P5270_05845 [Victivallales bacterium]|nr:hypothetical protein [Victivallales bacterium]HPO91584.1 hypothetical protein [Victivallales bacterium]HRR28868.1 hypothetical protein [Victivallales bacterium]